MIAPPPDVGGEITEALERHGIEPRAVSLVSPLGELKGRRWAYRVESTDGHIVKARQFEDGDTASRAFDLRADLEGAFAPALARYGSVLIEEWIEGVALAEPDVEAFVAEAGAVLGRLHSKPLGRGEPSALDTRTWRDGAFSDLELLSAAGRLGGREVEALRAEVSRRDPAWARAAVVHLDFCADNMVVDRSGRLRVIDNELITVGPAAFDLARTLNLWPMRDEAWAGFRNAYDDTVSAQPGPLDFWRLVATLTDARVFLERSEERVETALSRLRRFLGDEP